MIDVVVAGRDELAEDVVGLTLRAAGGGPLPAWRPGAHIDLRLAGDLVRQYSLCGDPADPGEWRVAVLREPDGRGGSAYVHDRLVEGVRLTADGPRNHFPLDPAPRYLFVAGGIGITPILPMIAAAEAAGAGWRLLYGGRRRSSMAFLPELAGYGGDRVSVMPQDEHGLLDLDGYLAGRDPGTLVYCCGPEPLLAAMEERCDPDSLRVERFAPKAVDGPVTSFEVQLGKGGRVLAVPEDRSILEVLEEAGVAVLSSCQEGTCGTCETGVLDGVPDHRDSILTPKEREAADVMMICVSRSCDARLVLDL
jgi:ferredoxin-NADP reductase